MKKFLSLIVLTIILSGTLFSQDCLNDIYYTIVNQKAYGKAMKMMDKKCMPGNEANAQVWLMKGNTYLFYALNEYDKKRMDTSYVIKNPEYIYVAYEAFKKAIELDKTIDDSNPKDGLYNSKIGQINCGPYIHDISKIAIKDTNYKLALDYLLAAQRCYGLAKDENNPKSVKEFEENIFWIYFDLAKVYQLLKDDENFKINIKKALNKNQDFPGLYYSAFKFFLSNNDTIECAKLIKKTKLVSSKSNDKFNKVDYFLLELSYYDKMSLVDSLKIRSLEMTNEIGINDTFKYFYIDLLGTLFNQLIDVETDQIITKYLEKYPEDFDMIKYKGLLYLVKVNSVNKENSIISESKTLTQKEKNIKNEENNILKTKYYEEAIIWLQKVYDKNPDDIENIKFLYSSIKFLRKPIDPAFEEKALKILSEN
jgi:hypothetical protein